MGLILRDGIWMKEIAVSNADIASLLLGLSRKKLKESSNLWNNFYPGYLAEQSHLAIQVDKRKI
jgi:hypothetical protein